LKRGQSKVIEFLHIAADELDEVRQICAGRRNLIRMRKLISIIVILAGYAGAAWGGAPPFPLTSLGAINALSNAEAREGLPVSIEATVTYYRWQEHLLFVQDGDYAAFIYATANTKLLPGDRVLVKGATRESFHPIIMSNDVTVLHHGVLPKALPASFHDLILGQFDCRLVTMRGVIRAADLNGDSKAVLSRASLQVLTDEGYIEADLDGYDQTALDALLDDEVEITGAMGGEFDDKMQVTGIVLHVPTSAQIKVLRRANNDLWKIPVTPMNRILGGYRFRDLSPRVRVQGTITYYQPGAVVVLQDGDRSLWIRTKTDVPLRVGDLADAIGFPEVMIADQARGQNDGFLALTHSEIKDSGILAPITSLPVTWAQLAETGDRGVGHHHDLVSIEGEVAVQARGGTQDVYTLVADGHSFTAIFRLPNRSPVAMRQIPKGSRVRVTGICSVRNSNPFVGPVEFDILLRSFDDIEVIQGPPLLNVRNLVLMVGLLLAFVAAGGGWGWKIERRMHRSAVANAVIEQQRGRILEDINGSCPLVEILEKIVSMVSAMQDGAPCWCEVADGATVGNCPREPHELEIVRVRIEARSGAALGTMLAAFDPRRPPPLRRAEALVDGVRLTTLAIETRRLYNDLRRRSEFDLLTDIHNRFSLEKRLDEQIAAARENAGIFGLIYIDLDGFKQINDLHGHHIGDLYLQEVALRMKSQLRPHDTLARLGGDEFSVLVPLVRSRAEVEEVAQRLERSFDEPFVIEQLTLHGAASVGVALYPRDGATRDELLNAADAAMYAAKNAKKQASSASIGPSR
jgi:diguanylate cyclase (GGDEF)-like protein